MQVYLKLTEVQAFWFIDRFACNTNSPDPRALYRELHHELSLPTNREILISMTNIRPIQILATRARSIGGK